jgi:16S rRNA (cytosine1402-N4)-methyltransferase
MSNTVHQLIHQASGSANLDVDVDIDSINSLSLPTKSSHITVLLNEAVDQVLQTPRGIDGVYVDGTFGRGGHSAALLAKLSPYGRLIALDRDAAAVAVGRTWQDARFTMVHQAFSELNRALTTLGIAPHQIDGILLDIGVSSPQLDEAARGFSFNKDAPLDMRMDTSCGDTAAQAVNTLSEAALIKIFKEFGEEPQAVRIAAAIVLARQTLPINTTLELAHLVERVVKFKKHGFHPATLIFQALRIYVNQELAELNSVLKQAENALCEGGKLAVISFHSLEDRMVKQTFRPAPVSAQLRHFPRDETVHPWKEIERIKPSDSESKANPRARSAVLRVAVRQGVQVGR